MFILNNLAVIFFVVNICNTFWYATEATTSLRQEIITSNNNSESYKDNHRRLLNLVNGDIFFGQSIFCASNGGRQYSNRLGFRLFEWFYINWFGYYKGSCGSQCNNICNHQPCLDDARASSSGDSCTCVSNSQSFCGSNTDCIDDECECKTGFNGNPLIANGSGCVDINECSTSELNNCGQNSICFNTPGSFNCECKSGYEGNPTSTQGCTNTNECTIPNICGPNGICEDIVGSYRCNCNTGYGNNVPTGVCQNINECLTVNCGPNAQCTDTQGSFFCSCNQGYAGTPPNQPCSNIDECTNPELNNCGPNTNCFDSIGSFSCECKEGFKGDPTSSQGCTDINECSDTNICGANGTCENTVGSYKCNCDNGYGNNVPTGVCQNINECLDSICGPNADCVDTEGSFTCTCNEGYTGTPPNQPCTDINECTDTPDICGANAICTNTPAGNFTCSCNDGFIGNPPETPCKQDCATLGLVCQANARCDVSGASAVCVCNDGFTGDPLDGCIDIDECLDPNSCASTETCFNNDGGSQCLINEWEACPTGNADTCLPGLQCAQTSRSQTSLVCCAKTGSCSGGNICCNGAYVEGERCPSQSSLDCAEPLECGVTASELIINPNPTYRCCEEPFINGAGLVICSLL